MIGTGRVWETSAISEPSVITSSTSSASAAVATVSEKVRQRRFGSVPSSSTRSRSAVGTRTAMRLFSGHSIRRVSPSSRMIVGRVDWKSKYSSGSIVAISSESSELPIAASAVEAAAAASFQPRKAQTMTGRAKMRQIAFPASRESTQLSVEDGRVARMPVRPGADAGAADQLGGHEQGQGGEGELQGAFGDVVGGGDAGEDAERREGADDRAPRAGGRCRSRAGGRADQGDDHDHQQRGRLALDLAEADEDGQRRDEEDAAADPDQAAGQAAGDRRRGLARRRSFI